MINKNNTDDEKKDLKVVFVLFLLLFVISFFFFMNSVKANDHSGAIFSLFCPFYVLIASLIVKRLVDGKGEKNEQ